MKIIVVSDNHGVDCLKQIKDRYKSADIFVHCGDSEQSLDELEGYVCVRGNNDYFNFDRYKILKIMNHRILIVHGDGYIFGHNRNNLKNKAKDLECDVVFFGHSHIFEHTIIDDVHLINPGSLSHNRDFTMPCFCEVELLNDDIRVSKVFL